MVNCEPSEGSMFFSHSTQSIATPHKVVCSEGFDDTIICLDSETTKRAALASLKTELSP